MAVTPDTECYIRTLLSRIMCKNAEYVGVFLTHAAFGKSSSTAHMIQVSIQHILPWVRELRS
jgi:hypothetical protein